MPRAARLCADPRQGSCVASCWLGGGVTMPLGKVSSAANTLAIRIRQGLSANSKNLTLQSGSPSMDVRRTRARGVSYLQRHSTFGSASSFARPSPRKNGRTADCSSSPRICADLLTSSSCVPANGGGIGGGAETNWVTRCARSQTWRAFLGCHSFGVRRQDTEGVTFRLIYRTKAGRQRWHTIGKFGVRPGRRISSEARRPLSEIDLGGDPVRDKI